MIYSTRRFVLCLTLCHFVLVFFSLLALRVPRLGKRELILVFFFFFLFFFVFVFFVCLFDLCLFGVVGGPFLLVSGKGCGL